MFRTFQISGTTYPRFNIKLPILQEADKTILMGKVLNFLNTEGYDSLTGAERASFINYIQFLYNSYFSSQEAEETEDVNNVVFKNTQWSILRKYSLVVQNYVIKTLFSEFNLGLVNYFDLSFVRIASDINAFQNYLNTVYESNSFGSNQPFMKKATSDAFVKDLKDKIDNIQINIDNGLKYISFNPNTNDSSLYFEIL